MARPRTGQPLVVPFDLWPELEQSLWNHGLRPGHVLDDPVYAASLRPMTLRNARRAYGRWLSVLENRGLLQEGVSPEARVTPQNVRTFYTALREAGNVNNSIIVRFRDLQAALRIMVPDADFSWLTAPGGISINSRIPPTTQPRKTYHSRDLYEWGEGLAQEALLIEAPKRSAVQYRNGLIIMVFASRAPRLRSMAALQLGKHVIKIGQRYRMILTAEDTKTATPIEYDLPASLTRFVDHYLTLERPELLGDAQHDWFWVGQDGERLAASGIEQMVRRTSLRDLGEELGTHRFRHALGTIVPLFDHEFPASAAALLGNSSAVAQKYYNHGNQAEAARRFGDVLQQERQATADLAREAFRPRRGRP
jgi:site-specific recombinase XerC